MSNRTSIAAASKDIIFFPLCKLKKYKNVRQIPHTKPDIHALAASICAIGMLQYPVVEPELGPKGKPTGHYLVNAGEGRRLAQLLRVKPKEIKADEPLRCILDAEHNATEVSLAENAIRADMHPADQYEAFAKLHNEDGMSAEDIAARFGVTAAVVRERLKLGAVSPKLMKLVPPGQGVSRSAPRSVYLSGHAPGIDESPAGKQIAEIRTQSCLSICGAPEERNLRRNRLRPSVPHVPILPIEYLLGTRRRGADLAHDAAANGPPCVDR